MRLLACPKPMANGSLQSSSTESFENFTGELTAWVLFYRADSAKEIERLKIGDSRKVVCDEIFC
jgi:hypothetical protein